MVARHPRKKHHGGAMGGRAAHHRAHVHHKRHHHAGHLHAHHTKMIMHHAKANGHGISLGQASHMAKQMREGGGLHAAGRGVRRGRMKGEGFWGDFADGFKKVNLLHSTSIKLHQVDVLLPMHYIVVQLRLQCRIYGHATFLLLLTEQPIFDVRSNR